MLKVMGEAYTRPFARSVGQPTYGCPRKPGLGASWWRHIAGGEAAGGEANVRYPTEAWCWNLYTPPGSGNQQRFLLRILRRVN